ncbi:hypothetical protein NHJ13734_000687 [Beauveria thailandica]
MASFFPRTIYNNEASFTPLFRLLDEFDTYSRQSQPTSGKQQQTQQQQQHFRKAGPVCHWQPKFDVRETADAYELHGELPGLNKNDVSVEFTEPQTLVVRGKVERTYTAGTSPNNNNNNNQKAVEAAAEEAAPAPSHKATVSDEDDASIQEENGSEVASEPSNTVARNNSNTTVAAPTDKAKYWLTERSIGEFARSFSFPSRVDQNGVTAGFQDGILSITVPKAKKHEPVRISIN